MKHQALFSSKDKSKKNKSVICCNFAWPFKGLILTLLHSERPKLYAILALPSTIGLSNKVVLPIRYCLTCTITILSVCGVLFLLILYFLSSFSADVESG